MYSKFVLATVALLLATPAARAETAVAQAVSTCTQWVGTDFEAYVDNDDATVHSFGSQRQIFKFYECMSVLGHSMTSN